MIKHIIFDCFGTLINTGNGSIKAVERILSNVGSRAEAVGFYSDWKKIKKQMMNDPVFKNEKILFELSLAENFINYGIKADASKEIQPMLESLFSERIAFPDVSETMWQLIDKGLDIAIGSTTDTDSLMHYLASNKLEFSHIFTSENMEVYKPNPLFYQTILRRSSWAVEECLFVGDSYIEDVCGPKSVGMKAVLLDRKGMYKDAVLNPMPDYIIHSLTELMDIV